MANKQSQFLNFLMRKGASATVTQITGTQCPCMVWKDASRPCYSAEYHRLYPNAENCNKTGLISRTTTTVAIKAMFVPVGLMANMSMLSKEVMTLIGELQKDDLVLYGAVNAATGAIYNLSNMNELQDKITFQGRSYIVRHYFDSWFENMVGQAGLLKRIV